MAAIGSHIPLPLTEGPGGSATGPPLALVRLRLLGSGCRALRLRRGEVLIRQGSPPPCVFLIDRGVTLVERTALDGRRAILDVLVPGDVIGEESFIGSERSPWETSEVRAIGPARALAPSRGELERALGGPEATTAWLARALARRLARVSERCALFLSRQLEERVRWVLGDLAHRCGRPSIDGLAIELPLTQDDIASMVGATRESVNRAIRALRSEGLVRRRRSTYIWTAGQPPRELSG